MADVVIMDTEGKTLGQQPFFQALQEGAIRGVVRVFVFNARHELYLQKRSAHTHIAPGLWDQSASGHIDVGETPLAAAKRELEEELGIKDVALEPIGQRYFEETYGDLTLRSYEYLYRALYDGDIQLQQSEIEGGRWVSKEILQKEIRDNPEQFTETISRINEIQKLFR